MCVQLMAALIPTSSLESFVVGTENSKRKRENSSEAQKPLTHRLEPALSKASYLADSSKRICVVTC